MKIRFEGMNWEWRDDGTKNIVSHKPVGVWNPTLSTVWTPAGNKPFLAECSRFQFVNVLGSLNICCVFI